MSQTLDATGYAIYNVGDFVTRGPATDARSFNDGLFNGTTLAAALTTIGGNARTL